MEPRHKIIEGGLTAVMGIFLFHNGIKIQRMALAARVVDRERREPR